MTTKKTISQQLWFTEWTLERFKILQDEWIAENQPTYDKEYDEDYFFSYDVPQRKMPLSFIPKFEHQNVRANVDHKKLFKKHPRLHTYESEEKLSDWFSYMLCDCMDIDGQYARLFRGWYIFYDELRDMYFRAEKHPGEVILNYWVDLVTND